MAESRRGPKRKRPTPLYEDVEAKKKMLENRNVFIGFHIDKWIDMMERLGLNSVGLVTHILHVHDEHCPTCRLASQNEVHKKRRENSSPKPVISLPVASTGDFAELGESCSPLPEPVVETDYAEDYDYIASPHVEPTTELNNEADTSGLTLQMDVEPGEVSEDLVSVKEEPVWDEEYNASLSQSDNSDSCNDSIVPVGQAWQLSNGTTNDDNTLPVTTEIKKEVESVEPQQDKVVPLPLMTKLLSTPPQRMVPWPVPTNIVKNAVQSDPNLSIQSSVQKSKRVVQLKPTRTARTRRTTRQMPVIMHTPKQQIDSIQPLGLQQSETSAQLPSGPIAQLQPSTILPVQQPEPQHSTETTKVKTSMPVTQPTSGSMSADEQLSNPPFRKILKGPGQSTGPRKLTGEPTISEEQLVATQQVYPKMISEVEANNKRLKTVKDPVVMDVESSGHQKSLRKNTRWGMKIFQDWHKETYGEPLDMLSVSADVLAKILTKFYCEATPPDPEKTRQSNEKTPQSTEKTQQSTLKSEDEDIYTVTSMKNIRSAINRLLLSLNRKIDIVHDREFKKANWILNGIIKDRKNGGATSSTQHHEIVTMDDLLKISNYLYRPVFDPETLRLCTWYILAIHFNIRGLEWYNQLPRNSFIFDFDNFGKEFACLTEDAKQKIYQCGCPSDTKSVDRRIYATNMDTCPVRVLKLFSAKINAHATKFFNKTNNDASENPDQTDVWYSDIPISKYLFAKFFPEISKNAGCSRRYTSQCLRATVMQAVQRSLLLVA